MPCKASPRLPVSWSHKHFILQCVRLTHFTALENGIYGIRIDVVCPAMVEGPLIEKAIVRMPGIRDAFSAACPLQRFAQASEIADSVVSLCSPVSSYTHGIALLVDGSVAVTAHAV